LFPARLGDGIKSCDRPAFAFAKRVTLKTIES
jgi:hypothetical protein